MCLEQYTRLRNLKRVFITLPRKDTEDGKRISGVDEKTERLGIRVEE
jgi:hypothetical protein